MHALPLLLLLAPDAQDDARWIERVEFPRLVQADLNLVVRDEDLGIEPMGLEFPDDPEVRVREAHARIQDGDRTSRTLHQAASGLVVLGDRENLRQVMPACINAYLTELRDTPDDVELRIHYAQALFLSGTFTRDDRFFRDAGVELAKVAKASPEDWRVLDQHAQVLIGRALFSRAEGGADPAWLERAAQLAGEAARLAPDRTAPRWRGFHTRYLALLRGGRGAEDGLFADLAALADELAVGAKEVDEPRLALVAEAYWFVSNLTPVAARFEGDELPAPAPEEVVRQRLGAFRERLAAAPESPLRGAVARAWWTLTAFVGDPESWREDADLAIAAGLPPEQAQVLALMGLHKRGEAELAAELALELAATAEGDHVWRALTVFRHETGDDAGALEALLQVEALDPVARLARALLELRTGAHEAARGTLEPLLREVTGTPLAGDVAHAYGVALALTGDPEGARLQLTLATRFLGEEKGAAAQATLDELGD